MLVEGSHEALVVCTALSKENEKKKIFFVSIEQAVKKTPNYCVNIQGCTVYMCLPPCSFALVLLALALCTYAPLWRSVWNQLHVEGGLPREHTGS